MSTVSVTAAITAENTFTSGIQLRGTFNLSIAGTWVATVTVQRSFDGTTWLDVEDYTANTQKIGEASNQGESVWYRVGVKTGNYTSGTCNVRLSQ